MRRGLTALFGAFGCAVSVLLGVTAAEAANLQISSTRLTLTQQQPITSLTVRNNSPDEVAVQAEVVAWNQDKGSDLFSPTREVLVNPAIFKVAAGREQVLRFGLQVGAAATERSYRLFLQELPHPQTAAGEIQTLLRFSVPIFVPAVNNTTDLQWVLTSGGAPSLSVDNRGARHIQITGLVLHGDGGRVLLDKKLSVYVLAGHRAELPFRPSAVKAGESVRLEIQSDAEPELAPVTLRAANAADAPR